MSKTYRIDGFEVTFTPWHSEVTDEWWMAVSVKRDGREVLHSGKTLLEPSEEQAREIVETFVMVDEMLKKGERKEGGDD